MQPSVGLEPVQSQALIAPAAAPRYLNSLEPAALVDAFLAHPPERFTTLGLGEGPVMTPGFVADFDILTTLDDSERWLKDAASALPFLSALTRHRTLFVGTTVSEYMVCPAMPDADRLVERLLSEMGKRRAQLAIVKDLPCSSPLIGATDNDACERLLTCLRAAGFQVVAGQALAYVPIDFDSIDEYMGRLSSIRRKEFRKKLKQKAALTIDEHRTGSQVFADSKFTDELYRLYLNVFAQSKYHFDKLTMPFFESVLNDAGNDGVLFVYRRAGELVGWNLCFEHRGNLVDKYVGFAYPQCRDNNLYFVSWFYNLEYALRRQLKAYIAGWTDPEVKAALGASFTFTRHAVFVRNSVLRYVLKRFQHLFEPDSNWAAGLGERKGSAAV